METRELMAGALAGVVGTLAMDALWYGRHRRDGGDDSFTEWEFASGVESFEDAAAPGQVARRLAGLVGVELPDAAAGTSTNVMHWLTGVGYGVAHSLLAANRGVLVGGLQTGGGAFANSYATLGAMGVYEPIWEYDAEELGKDLSAHLLFGLATSAAYTLFSRGR